MVRRAGNAVYVHVVWATWDRLPLITEEIKPTIYRAIGAACGEMGAEVIALGGVEDHVHLLVHQPATVSVADLVKRVKSASSHLASHTPQRARAFSKWQGAYGASSISPEDLSAISAYIADQPDHHAAGTLTADWELPDPSTQHTSGNGR